MLLKAREEFNEWLSRYGRSTCDDIMREHFRRRVPPDRPKQDQFKWGEYVRLYRQQRGVCPLCGDDMPLIKGKIEMDHINSQLTGEEYNARQNRQVVCKPCNAEKNATTVPDLAKRTGKTMVDIVKPGYMANDIQPDDEPIAADWPDEPPENERPVSEAEYRGAAADYEAHVHRGAK